MGWSAPPQVGAGSGRWKAEKLFRGDDVGHVLGPQTPLVDATRRPLPVLGGAHFVVVGHFRDLGGVFDHAAERREKVTEHVVAGPVAPRSPRAGDAIVAHAAD